MRNRSIRISCLTRQQPVLAGHVGRSDRAEEMLMALSTFFRTTVDRPFG